MTYEELRESIKLRIQMGQTAQDMRADFVPRLASDEFFFLVFRAVELEIADQSN